MSVPGTGRDKRTINDAPAHAEVNEPVCPRFHFRDQVFAAAMDPANCLPLETEGKRIGDRLTQRVPGELNVRYLFSDYDPAKFPRYGFNFRQLGHFSSTNGKRGKHVHEGGDGKHSLAQSRLSVTAWRWQMVFGPRIAIHPKKADIIL